MFHTLFFRLLAIIAFFTTLCFKYIIPLGTQYLGLGFAQMFLDVVSQGVIPVIPPLEMTTVTNEVLQLLPFQSWQGSLIFSLISYGLHRLLYTTNNPSYLKNICIGLLLYIPITIPYAYRVLQTATEHTAGWLLIFFIGSIFVIITSIADVQNAPKIRAIPTALQAMAEKLWNAFPPAQSKKK